MFFRRSSALRASDPLTRDEGSFMKRIYAIIFALVLAAVLAGCGGSAAGLSQSDLYLQVDGTAYRCRDNIEQIIADLGEDYTYAEGKSCNYDGLDKTFTYENATFYTNPLSEGDMVSEIYSESNEITTSRGIGVGAARADVLNAYGEPGEQDESLLLYRASAEIGQPALCFELEDGIVTAVCLTLEPV